MSSAPAFYCVADDRYFLGAVGLVNSLRLVGHSEPIFLLDCGLTPRQRGLLAGQVTVLDGPPEVPPWLLKAVAPLRHPARSMVLVDADMVIVRSLAPLIAEASAGRIVAFRDRQQRYFAEWGELLGLGPVDPRPYVSSGLVFLDDSLGARVLRLMEECRDKVDFDRTFWRGNDRQYPFLYADQDVLNAILSTRVDAERLMALANRLAPNPPYRGLRVTDEAGLRCAYRDGTEPYALHQYVRKPWLERSYHGAYSRLLARLLIAPDVSVRVPEAEVPSHLRSGLRARGERAVASVRDFMRWRFGDRLPAPVGTRLEDMRRRREGGGT
jgi:hypothetical protein